jgi:outer membrane protein assembly factor BamB
VAFDLEPRRAVAVFNAYGLVVFNAQYGKEVFRHRWDTRYDVNAAMPLVQGDQIFLSSNYNKGCTMLKIEGNAAKVLWENRNMRNHFNTSIWWKGHLYGFDDSTLACLDAKSGESKWEERGLGKGSVMMADGKLIVLSEKGELVIADADPAGFKPISRAHVIGGKCWTVPVLSNGRIYCRNAEGDLVCLDVRGS